MAEIKYQIFISSTYADLVEERQIISRSILDMGHIPAGMEMFPASDTEQLDYIKKVIVECDYYVLILGARYGSLDPEGVSFTEQEYEYAVQTDKTVLAFVHKNMDEISFGKTDQNDDKYQKLVSFKGRVCNGRLVKFWTSANELGAQAILALTKVFSANPQIGWVRANNVPENSTIENLLKLRNEIDDLNKEILRYKKDNTSEFDDAAGLDSSLKLNYTATSYDGRVFEKVYNITYRELLRITAPVLMSQATFETAVQSAISGLQERFKAQVAAYHGRNNSEFRDSLLHLVAIGMLKMFVSDNAKTYFQLTELGQRIWLEMSYKKI